MCNRCNVHICQLYHLSLKCFKIDYDTRLCIMPMFKNIVCFFIHTFCLHSECLIGYYWINCSRKCPYPYFGTKCIHMCICPENNCNFALGCHTGKWIFIILTLNYDIGVCTLCCLNTELCECQQHKEQKTSKIIYIRVNNSKNEIYRCCANHWRGHWCECHGVLGDDH